jgi:hypothetical protein
MPFTKFRQVAAIIASGVVAFCLAVGLFLFLAFRGNLDRGTFDVLRTTKNSEGVIAIMGERFDHEAMSGNDYFILLANHTYSPDELRLAYHRDQAHMVFRANRDDLNVSWADAHELVVDCRKCEITKGNINSQSFSVGEVRIRYTNFP